MKAKSFLESIDRKAIIAYTDARGIIIYVNDNFCKISGYSREELIGKSHRVINSSYHPKEFWEIFWRTIKSGKVWMGEICNKAKDGSHYWVNTTISPEVISGEVVGFYAIRFDITKHKAIEKKNKELTHLLHRVEDIAGIGGWEYIIETGDVTLTPQFYSLFKIPREAEFNLETLFDFYLDGKGEEGQELLKRAIENGESFDRKFNIMTFKGEELLIRSVGVPVYDYLGNIIKVNGIYQDLSKLDLFEKQIAHEKRKSIHSAKLAMIGETISSIIHEISNPITVIQGLYRSASRKESVDDIKKYLSKMDSPMERLLKMVKNMRQFSRNEAMSREEKVCKLNDIIDQSIEYVHFNFLKKGIQISRSFEEAIEFFCEPSELEQVIVNLLNNAIDAIENTPNPWVKVELFKNERGRPVITVTDSGNGIPREIADNMFQSFFTTKERGKGTGIGLAVVKDIMDQHKSIIYVNHECRNTQFKLIFDDILYNQSNELNQAS